MDCKHGLPEGTCAYCNNNGFSIKSEEKGIFIEPIEKEYKERKHLFKNIKELWIRDEIELIYEEFKGVHKKKDFRKKTFEVSLVLERTQAAVRWMVKHVFSKRTDLHRGQEVIMFRKEKGL